MRDAISVAGLKTLIAERRLAGFKLPSVMTPEEWAEEVYRLPGGRRFRWSYAPFAKGMFSAIWDSRARETVYQCFSRGFKTTCTLLAAGYCMDQAPRRILWMWQTCGHAEKFSKEGLTAELLETTPALNYLVGGNRRIASNTITMKRFPGGWIMLFGANAPGELRRSKGNLLIADEIDAYEVVVSDEGEILAIFDKRGSEYPDTIRIKASYPSLTGHSRIQSLLNESDYNEWHVTCLLCGGEPFVMHRKQLRYEEGKPGTARLECPRCAGLLTDAQRYAMAHEQGFDNWKPRNEFKGRHGFHANNMLWPHAVDETKYPGGALGMIASEEMAVKHAPDQKRALRVLVNTGDAEPFDPTEEHERPPEWKPLYERRGKYGLVVPKEGLFLTCFTDCQKRRLETGWRVWGRDEESWGLDYRVTMGYVGDPETWRDLALELSREFTHVSGAKMRLGFGFIDGGHYADDVYRFFIYLSAYFDQNHTQHSEAHRFFKGVPARSLQLIHGHLQATKGEGRHPYPVVSLGKMMTIAKNLKGRHIGTWQAKDIVYERLRYAKTEPLPLGFMHYNEQYPQQYFEGLTMETATQKIDGAEVFNTYKDEVTGNEPLDIEVGCLAAVRFARCNWDQLERQLNTSALEPEQDTPKAAVAVAASSGQNWATGGMNW